jgi:hypothetical protein
MAPATLLTVRQWRHTGSGTFATPVMSTRHASADGRSAVVDQRARDW